VELKDDYTYPIGAHRITIGTQNQFYTVANLFSRDSYGVYTFGSLDSLAMGKPNSYSVPMDAGGRIEVHMKAAQYAFYAQDDWRVSPDFSLTYGLRADIPVLRSKPATTQLVLDSLGRNTSVVPSGNVQWSPRVGFNWDVTGDERNQLRGGVGMFVGHPAYVWLSNAYQNSGSGLGLLSCTTRPDGGFSGAGPAPDFVADPNEQPTTCANGAGLSSFLSEVDLLSKELKVPQTLRFSLGYTPTISNFDQPHKVVLTGTYSFPTKTDLSLTYIGQSGEVFDYVYGGRNGDVNADGVFGNDLIYVPTNANDPSQIVFEDSPTYGTAAAQAAAFEKFIGGSSCLSEHRGRILERNSCRSPWQNIMNFALRQRLPQINGNEVAVQVDVYNFLNLLNSKWGLVRFPASFSNVDLLEHVGETSTVAGQQMPIVQFDPSTVRLNSENLQSNYQIQLAVRYSFY